MGYLSNQVVTVDAILTKKGRDYSSNFDEDNLEHLMSLKNTTPKKHKPAAPKLRTNDIKDGEPFLDLSKLILNLKRKEVCNLTLDELLDKTFVTDYFLDRSVSTDNETTPHKNK